MTFVYTAVENRERKSGYSCVHISTSTGHGTGHGIRIPVLNLVRVRGRYLTLFLRFYFLSWCMHATRSQNLERLNADDVLRAMWQKSRALIENCGSLATSGFSSAF